MLRFSRVLLMAIVLAGCQPHIYDVYVIVLPPGDDVVAVNTGKSHNRSIWFDDAVVTAYRITRDGYSLLGQLDFMNANPSIEIAAHDNAGGALVIEPLRFGACGSFDSAGRTRDVDGYPARRYKWSPTRHRACEVEGREPYPPGQVISFEVRSPTGELLGIEEIPFDLQRNGKYLLIDGL